MCVCVCVLGHAQFLIVHALKIIAELSPDDNSACVHGKEGWLGSGHVKSCAPVTSRRRTHYMDWKRQERHTFHKDRILPHHSR